MVIIGLTGHKGAGKDTCADYLVKNFGYIKASFATPMKLLLSSLFDFPVSLWESQRWKETPNNRLYGKTPRAVAQSFGTEWGRQMVHPDIWVDAAMRKVAGLPRVVFSDVRFDNEANAILRQGGEIIRLEKDGYEYTDNHPSEAGVSDNLVSLVVRALPGDINNLHRAMGRIIRGGNA